MTVNWGVISTARINAPVLAAARVAEGAQVLAIASRDAARARRYADEHGIERSYGSYDALLADPDVHAVYISLPNNMHTEWSIRALQAGKHVLCEKPFSPRESDVQRAFDEADKAQRLLMEAFMYRHNPQAQALAQLVADGAVGRLRLVRGAFSFRIGPERDGDIRLTASMEGGGLLDVGCYCISAARLLAGEPRRVYGEQALGGDGVDVCFAATLRFDDDVLGHFDCGVQVAGRGELQVVGEDGVIDVRDPWHCREPEIVVRRGTELEVIEVIAADSYQLQLENFSAAIEGTEQPLLGREDAVGQARTIEALLASAGEGRAITL